jgi:FKBP-type peptidyl-prolyl cis-trans isomerase
VCGTLILAIVLQAVAACRRRVLKRALAAPLALAVLVVAGCGYSDPYKQSGPVAAVGTPTPSASSSSVTGGDTFDEGANLKQVTFPNGVKYADIKVGTGTRAQAGTTITADYTLFLVAGGKKLQSSKDPGGTKLTGNLIKGNGGLIPGFVDGVAGMKVGGVRRIFIPSNQGYGAQPPDPSIPANSDLLFIVTLYNVTATSPSPSPS